MVIDIFTHLAPKSFLTRMEASGSKFGNIVGRLLSVKPLYDLDVRFRAMDVVADYRQVICLPNPSLEEMGDASQGLELARVANDEMAELCRRHPDRFTGFVAAVHLDDMEGSLREAERAITTLGAKGVQTYTNIGGHPLDETRFRPFFAAMADWGRPIWLHPTRSAATKDYASEEKSRFEMWWCFGWPYDTSVAMTRLVLDGIFDRHPDLDIITHHAGGMIPFFDGRVGPGLDVLGSRTADEDYSQVLPSLKRPHLDYFKQFYGDTAMFGATTGVKCGLDFFGADHILFSTDAPLGPIKKTFDGVNGLDLDAPSKAKVFYGNAAKLLRLDALSRLGPAYAPETAKSRREDVMRNTRIARGAIVAAFVAGAAQASADPIEDFYRGRSMQMVIRTGVGGDYDMYARLLARFMGAHIPGEPTILPVNMPGGGGIVAANYVGAVAPKDGSVLTIVSQGLSLDQGMAMSQGLKVDLSAFNWLGSMANSNQLIVTWHTSRTQSLADARSRETLIGATGAGSISIQIPAFCDNVLGTRFKIISGYPDGSDIDLAMERGEVDGRGANPYAGYLASKPSYLADKLITPIVQIGLAKEPGLPDTPLLIDQQVASADKPLLALFTRSAAIGRPIAVAPGVPTERVAALRRAFDATLRDPAFLAEAARENIDIRPTDGETLSGLVRAVIDAPADTRARMRAAIEPTSMSAGAIVAK